MVLSKWLEHHQNSSGKNLSCWWPFSRWQMQDFWEHAVGEGQGDRHCNGMFVSQMNWNYRLLAQIVRPFVPTSEFGVTLVNPQDISLEKWTALVHTKLAVKSQCWIGKYIFNFIIHEPYSPASHVCFFLETVMVDAPRCLWHPLRRPAAIWRGGWWMLDSMGAQGVWWPQTTQGFPKKNKKTKNMIITNCKPNVLYAKLLIQIAHHLFLLPSFAAIAAIQEWKDRFERLQERFPMLSTLAGCN